jgi:hypothetical protein
MIPQKDKHDIPWRVILLGWTAIFLFNVVRNFLASTIRGVDLIWDLFLASGLAFFGLWVVVTPLVLQLAAKFRIERDTWLKNSMILLAAGAALGFVNSLLHELFRHYVFPQYQGGTSLRFMVGTSVYVLEYNLLLYGVIVVSYNTVEYFRGYRIQLEQASELKTLLARSELAALKMQLHPHFLFNTHHAIVGLMLRKETEKAIRMLVKLSDLLRLTLGHSDQDEITLSDEIALISLYLEMQQIRFGERLRITTSVSNDLLNAYVPTFLLQPIVENSINHGIAAHSSAGQISICAERRNGILNLEVSDDGAHVELKNELPLHTGVGIHTTINRLAHLYGHSARLAFVNREPRGVRVSITIPYHEVSGPYH